MKIFSLLFLLFVGAISAQAQQNFTVDTTVDDATLSACTAAAGDCSLRGAIARANEPGVADTIDFVIPAYDTGCTAGGICTITLRSGVGIGNAAATGALTITNSTGASNLLISGSDVSTVFFVLSGANLSLNGVTVTNGYTPCGSGGINNDGILSVTNSIVSGNTGSDGGGISNGNSGTLTLTNSTVSGNTASGGGGIINYGTATLLNSTVSGNTATDSNGGGIYNQGTLNLTSVTVAYNSTTNPGSTGGGVFNINESPRRGTANLFNTIVANNTSAGTAPDFSGAISPASSFNLIGNGAGMSGITNGDANGNQVGTPLNPIDPKLGSLALNGGTTLTHALLPGSPAIDQGNATGTDQRGFARPVDNPAIANATSGNGADIGAFEVQTANAMPTTKEQCKNGGWMNFTFPRAFKNQGDCIQFVNTGK